MRCESSAGCPARARGCPAFEVCPELEAVLAFEVCPELEAVLCSRSAPSSRLSCVRGLPRARGCPVPSEISERFSSHTATRAGKISWNVAEGTCFPQTSPGRRLRLEPGRRRDRRFDRFLQHERRPLDEGDRSLRARSTALAESIRRLDARGGTAQLSREGAPLVDGDLRSHQRKSASKRAPHPFFGWIGASPPFLLAGGFWRTASFPPRSWRSWPKSWSRRRTSFGRSGFAL